MFTDHREYVPISQQCILEKFKEILPKFPHHMDDDSQLMKDLSRIGFDFENSFWPYESNGKIEGYIGDRYFGCDTIVDDNDCDTYAIFAFAGGDWEVAVDFVIYWDGDQLRGYIPHHGNLYNMVTNKAFGNETSEFEDSEQLINGIMLKFAERKFYRAQSFFKSVEGFPPQSYEEFNDAYKSEEDDECKMQNYVKIIRTDAFDSDVYQEIMDFLYDSDDKMDELCNVFVKKE